jgi:hypothetical protein
MQPEGAAAAIGFSPFPGRLSADSKVLGDDRRGLAGLEGLDRLEATRLHGYGITSLGRWFGAHAASTAPNREISTYLCTYP